MTGKKRHAITEANVQCVFNDACVAQLVKCAKLPPGTNLELLAKGIRQAASIYAREVRLPTLSEVRDEVQALYRAAEHRQYDRAASLRAQLSPETLRYLKARLSRPGPRAAGLRLPTEEELRDPKRRENACIMIERLCRAGGRYVESRKDRRSISRQPQLLGPAQPRYLPEYNPKLNEAGEIIGMDDVREPAPRPAKRDAERHLVANLRLACLEATGSEKPITTVNPAYPDPFANFVHECLQLVGASHTDAIALVNELHLSQSQRDYQEAKAEQARQQAAIDNFARANGWQARHQSFELLPSSQLEQSPELTSALSKAKYFWDLNWNPAAILIPRYPTVANEIGALASLKLHLPTATADKFWPDQDAVCITHENIFEVIWPVQRV